MFIRKTFRSINKFYNFLCQKCIKLKLTLLYNNINIDSKTYIGKNCNIKCFDGGELIIKESFISDFTTIIVGHKGKIEIYKSYIGQNSVIVANKLIIIDEFCQIAEMVTIRDQNHKYQNSKYLKIIDQGFDNASISIGKNVWIASKATILKGVTIGDNAVIGAHSLVNKDCDTNSIYVGIPAKKIKEF